MSQYNAKGAASAKFFIKVVHKDTGLPITGIVKTDIASFDYRRSDQSANSSVFDQATPAAEWTAMTWSECGNGVYQMGALPAGAVADGLGVFIRITWGGGQPNAVQVNDLFNVHNLANITNGAIDSVTTVTGNVNGSVASVTGAVASVTGNVGGNVVGSVASVTGAVASVTGNVGGNVTGSVGSVAGNVAGNVTGSVGSVAGNVTGSVASVTGNVGGSVNSVTQPVATQDKPRTVIRDLPVDDSPTPTTTTFNATSAALSTNANAYRHAVVVFDSGVKALVTGYSVGAGNVRTFTVKQIDANGAEAPLAAAIDASWIFDLTIV